MQPAAGKDMDWPSPVSRLIRGIAAERVEVHAHRSDVERWRFRADFSFDLVEQSAVDNDSKPGVSPFLFLVRSVIDERVVKCQRVTGPAEPLRKCGQQCGLTTGMHVNMGHAMLTAIRRQVTGTDEKAQVLQPLFDGAP